MFSQWRPLLFKLYPFLLTLVSGLFLTGLTSWGLQKQSAVDAAGKLEQQASLAVLQIESRLNEQAAVLRGLQAAFYAQPELDLPTFNEILDDQNILFRLPGFVAIAFSPLLNQADATAFITKKRSTHGRDMPAYRDYTIQPPPTQPHVQPIDYLYPINSSTAAYLGLDILSLTPNRSALTISRDEARGIASPPFTLSLSASTPLGFMVHYPVYRGKPRPSNIAERQMAYRGSLTVIYRADQVLSVLKEDISPRTERIRILDTGGSLDRAMRQSATLLYETPQAPSQPNPDWLCSHKLIPLPGRQWRMEMCATPMQLSPQNQDQQWFIWLVGTGLSLLVASILQMQKRATQQVEISSQEMKTHIRKHETHCQKLAALIEKTSDIVVTRNGYGQIEYANPVAQRHFSLDNTQPVKSGEPLLLSAEIGVLAEPLQAYSSHRDTLGTVRHYDATVIPVFDANNAFCGSVLHAREITQTREQNEALLHKNERYAALLELACDWQWEQDAEGRFTEVSGRIFKKQDINPAHMVGLTRKELALAGLSEEEWVRHCKTIENRQSYRDFIFTLRGGKNPLVLSLSGTPIYDTSGYFLGYQGIGRDITAQQQARNEELAAMHRMQATLESLSDGVICTDLAGKVIYMNPVAEALTGRETKQAIDQPIEIIFQLVDPVSRLPLPSLSRQILAYGHTPVRHRTGILINRFGLSISIQEAVSGIRDEHNTIIGSVIVFRDLSDWTAQLQ